MFHVRRLITQLNLSTFKYLTLNPNNNKTNLIIKENSFINRGQVTNYSNQTTKAQTQSQEKNNSKNNSTTSNTSSNEETINITEPCIKRLKELEGTNQYLRIAVDSGGCSGFEYKFSLDSTINSDDKIIEKENCKILIDKETLGFIKGATLDHYEELIRAGFRIINNPNSEHACSCGTSFSIKI